MGCSNDPFDTEVYAPEVHVAQLVRERAGLLQMYMQLVTYKLHLAQDPRKENSSERQELRLGMIKEMRVSQYDIL